MEITYPATVRDMSSIAKCEWVWFIIGGCGNVVHMFIAILTVKAEAVTPPRPVRNGHSPQTAVSTLQELCADLHIATPLDKTLIEMWDSYVPPLKLFQQTASDTPPGNGGCGTDISTGTCASMNLHEDKHLFQESVLFESGYHDNISMTPTSSPIPNKASTVATPTSVTRARRRVGF